MFCLSNNEVNTHDAVIHTYYSKDSEKNIDNDINMFLDDYSNKIFVPSELFLVVKNVDHYTKLYRKSNKKEVLDSIEKEIIKTLFIKR